MIPGLRHHADPQGSDEWHEARRGVITGSRFKDARDRKVNGSMTAVALGYAQDLARERCGGLLLPMFATPAMRIGTKQEPAARLAYEIQTGCVVDECGFWATEDGLFGVSPDGLVGDDGLIEIKTMCSSATLFRAVVDRDIRDYRDQIVGELWLLRREWCDLCLWAPDLGDGGALVIRRICRDEEEIDTLAADLVAFAGTVERLEAALRSAIG